MEMSCWRQPFAHSSCGIVSVRQRLMVDRTRLVPWLKSVSSVVAVAAAAAVAVIVAGAAAVAVVIGAVGVETTANQRVPKPRAAVEKEAATNVVVDAVVAAVAAARVADPIADPLNRSRMPSDLLLHCLGVHREVCR